jgi:hypothetical protein
VPTTDATVEVAVRATGDERSGAGILARYDPATRTYILFAVGPLGGYYVVLRGRKSAQIVAAGISDAIRVGEVNELRVRTVGETLIFDVNGTPVVRFPGGDAPGRLVGIGAFGRGAFRLEEVRISPPGVEGAPPAEADGAPTVE